MLGLANGLPRESIGHYSRLGQPILVELNPNILVRVAIRIKIISGARTNICISNTYCNLMVNQCYVYLSYDTFDG